MSNAELSRRRMLLGIGAGGALALGGCDRIGQSSFGRGVLKLGEEAHYHSQRLLARNALATEYKESDKSPVFRANGSRSGTTPEYKRHLANGFRDWKLQVDGLVQRPLALSLDALRSLPQRTQITRHDCVEGWSAIAKWTGPQLGLILKMAKIEEAARFIVFYCADFIGGVQYYESIDMNDAYHPQTILAHRMNDGPLPEKNGAPVRVRVERQLGYKHAKFIMRIEARERIDDLFGGKGGYWEDHSGYAWYAGI